MENKDKFKGPLTSQIKDTAGDNVPAEIAYYDSTGRMVGYWAYGHWEPGYPYQGQEGIKVITSEGVNHDS